MKYVDGGTLADVLKKRGRLEVKEAARIIRDVAAGLQAAHEKGIVHRDMKASNVMLTNQGHVYVMDFGLAKVAQARTQLTQQGDVMGTPLYMSPEQALGATVDRRSDIYSLGVMFYQILSGRPPYIDDSALVILEKHRSAPIPDVSSIVREVPAQIGAMIVKMMAKRREDRYQSCAEIVQELNTYIETGTPGLVVSEDVFRDADEARRTMRLGRRPSRPSSPRKPLRMSKPLAIGLVLVLVLVLGAVAALYFTAKTPSTPRTQDSGLSTQHLAPPPSVMQHPVSSIQQPEAGPAEKGAWDDVYVTTAATGEKIPHPMSRKTYKQTLADGTTIDVPEGMVYIPAGEFTMGEGGSEHKVYLDDYFIGKYEVTNAEWKVFCDLTGFAPLPAHWRDGKFPEGKENHPVVYLSWEDIKKYCEWVSKETGREVKLPTEAQWEKAARGPNAYIYPWGNAWDKELCNTGYLLAQFGFKPNDEAEDWTKKWEEWKNGDKGKEIISAGGNTTPVGLFPKSKCFYGCYDMAGNASEWCQDWFTRNYHKLKDAKRNPQGPTEDQADEAVVDSTKGTKGKARLLRGGSWNCKSGNCRTVFRSQTASAYRNYGYGANGFRLVLLPSRRPVEGLKAEPQPSSLPAQVAKSPWDDVSVTTAATGEKIPHPLSRKTVASALPDGTSVNVPEGMVYIPAGEFTMGVKESKHRVYLDAYFIGKYEVTNAEWKAFIDATGFTPLPQHWKDGKIPQGKENHPVVNVSWEDIQKYCEWASKETGRDVRLPTEAQWVKAARGPKGFVFPWGNTWDKKLCNNAWLLGPFGLKADADIEPMQEWFEKYRIWAESDKGKEIFAAGGNTTPVGSFPDGKCPYGCYDMAGNVHEWCSDWFTTNYYKLKDAGRNPEGPTEEQAEEMDLGRRKMKVRVLRGGAWNRNGNWCQLEHRYDCYAAPFRRSSYDGFRVVVRLTHKAEKVETEGRGETAKEKQESAESVKSVDKSFDDVYVTTAATGEKIPHPLSRKKYTDVLPDGTSVEAPEGMVYIPPGEFWMGPPDGPSRHKVYLDAYFIGKYEVTNAEWKVFVDSTGFTPLPSHWKGGTFPEGRGNHPFAFASQPEAKRYCEWVSKQTGRDVRLSTAAQWENAAHGSTGYRYPWGQDWDPRRCNNQILWLEQSGFKVTPVDKEEDIARKWNEFMKTPEAKELSALGGGTTPVGSFPMDKSGYGCYDMAGNASECCSDWFKADDWWKLKDANRNPQGPSEEEADPGKFVVILGGSWKEQNASSNCRTYWRRRDWTPTPRARFHGFRIVELPRPQAEGAGQKAEEGFVRLFNGKDLEGWVVMGDAKRWTVSDGVLRCDGRKALDWLRSAREYGDFILKLDWRVSENGNSGVWLRAPEAKNLKAAGTVQVQICTEPQPDPKVGNAALMRLAAPASPRPATPNEWHSFEIRCVGYRYTVLMDGTQVMDAGPEQVPELASKPLKGYIGLEESWTGPEGYSEFRNIRIKELKAADIQKPGTGGKTGLDWKQSPTSLALLRDGRTVWRLSFDSGEGKPYFHPLALPDGTELTALRPPQYPWHRALWWSWKFINGVNYWEEDRKTGLSEGRTELVSVKATPDKDGSARVEMELAYHPPNDPAVLTERRILSVGAPDAAGNYRIDWTSSFTAHGKGATLACSPVVRQPDGKWRGGYAGLSARMAQATQGWKFLSSEGETDPVKNNSKPARWLDFSGESASGGAGGMCIFDHPKNLRHPSPWHVVADMPFFSPAPLFNGPHVLKAQESLTLRYRILVHAGLLSKAELEKEWKDFASRLTGAVRGQR